MRGEREGGRGRAWRERKRKEVGKREGGDIERKRNGGRRQKKKEKEKAQKKTLALDGNHPS